jgi:hypothetical protein
MKTNHIAAKCFMIMVGMLLIIVTVVGCKKEKEETAPAFR